jgi:uroporphyrinogen-III synthase
MPERALLLRSGDESDPYEEALEADGFAVDSLAVLSFDVVHGEALRSALEHPNSYDGLILTSPRAVDALGDALPWLPAENMLWHNKASFAVGPRTADALRSIGFEPQGEESGSAEMLADLICGLTFRRPLLFLCGNRRREVLPDRLHEAGVDFEEICVYVSRPRSDLNWPIGRRPDWIVFFSPSGYEAVRQAHRANLGGARIAAIGATTAAALRSDGWEVAAVAMEPSPAGLRAAIRSAAGR